MLPDWAIFLTVLVIDFLTKSSPNTWTLFGLTWIFNYKLLGLLFGKLLEEFGLLFIPTSGHTGY